MGEITIEHEDPKPEIIVAPTPAPFDSNVAIESVRNEVHELNEELESHLKEHISAESQAAVERALAERDRVAAEAETARQAQEAAATEAERVRLEKEAADAAELAAAKSAQENEGGIPEISETQQKEQERFWDALKPKTS